MFWGISGIIIGAFWIATVYYLNRNKKEKKCTCKTYGKIINNIRNWIWNKDVNFKKVRNKVKYSVHAKSNSNHISYCLLLLGNIFPLFGVKTKMCEKAWACSRSSQKINVVQGKCTWACGGGGKDNRVLACMLSYFSHVWLFATLWRDYCLSQAPLSMGFSRQE